EFAIILPLGQDYQGVGPTRGFVGAVGKVDPVEQASCIAHCLRIVRRHMDARLLEDRYDGKRCRFAHVVGLRLEGKSEDSNPASTPHRGLCEYPMRQCLLAQVIALDKRLDENLRHSMPPAAGGKSTGVLGKAGAAIAGSGHKE